MARVGADALVRPESRSNECCGVDYLRSLSAFIARHARNVLEFEKEPNHNNGVAELPRTSSLKIIASAISFIGRRFCRLCRCSIK
jgi:hypothetical protein